MEDGHSSSVNELPSKFILLKDEHEAVTEGFSREGCSVIFMFKKIVEEVFRDLEVCRGLISVVAVVDSFDKNC